ncbi:MAG: hypothetical protein WAS73_09625 [Defluviicoccus sp.]
MLAMIISLAVLFVISAHDAAAEIVGRASVVDGATIEIRGQRIRLFGIDAPESSQLCTLDDKSYRCGQQSVLASAGRSARGRRCPARVDAAGVSRTPVDRGEDVGFRRQRLL